MSFDDVEGHGQADAGPLDMGRPGAGSADESFEDRLLLRSRIPMP